MELRDQLQQTLCESHTLERELGGGGMATVYLAQDLKHKRRVAVNVLKVDVACAGGRVGRTPARRRRSALSAA